MSMYWLDRAVENFERVWPILMETDYSGQEKYAERMAFRKHIELLKANVPDAFYGKRVPTIKELKRRYMRGFNLMAAGGVAKILDTIEEGQTYIYGGLEITLKEGEIHFTRAGQSVEHMNEKGEPSKRTVTEVEVE